MSYKGAVKCILKINYFKFNKHDFIALRRRWLKQGLNAFPFDLFTFRINLLTCLYLELFTLARLRLITSEFRRLRLEPSARSIGAVLVSSSFWSLSASFSPWNILCLGSGLLISCSKSSWLTVWISEWKFWTTAGSCEAETTFTLGSPFPSATLPLLERKAFNFSDSCQNSTPFPKLVPSSLCHREVGNDLVRSPAKSFLFLTCSMLFHLPARAIEGQADLFPLLFDLLNNCSKLLCLQGFLKWLFRLKGECKWMFVFVSAFGARCSCCCCSCCRWCSWGGPGSCSVSLSHTTSLARSCSVTWRSCGVAASLESLGAASKWRVFIWVFDWKMTV